jgi:hypothetical protein
MTDKRSLRPTLADRALRPEKVEGRPKIAVARTADASQSTGTSARIHSLLEERRARRAEFVQADARVPAGSIVVELQQAFESWDVNAVEGATLPTACVFKWSTPSSSTSVVYGVRGTAGNTGGLMSGPFP